MSAPSTASATVVGVDTSSCSRAALRWALADAEAHHRSVQAVMCYREGGSHRHPTIPALAAQKASNAEEVLEGIVAEELQALGHPDVEVTSKVVAVGAGGVDDALVRCARGAELLVVGRRGIHGIRKLLLGSVSRGCVEVADCPVVVVPCGDD